ncbi:hypothetical protein ABZW44_21120 [Streptomyces mirabilis]|uniref:hypothetical protein n=1 Tax=Streptomyces mirabilis TaxID=68239 RepID=UPI0033A37176
MTLTQDAPVRTPARKPAPHHASLIVKGKDRTGIVAAVGAVLSGHDANIVPSTSTPTIRRAARSSSARSSAWTTSRRRYPRSRAS